MSAQEVPLAEKESKDLTDAQPGSSPSLTGVKSEPSANNGQAPESSSPAEICVILGESQRAQTPPVTPGTPGSYTCGICGKKYKYYNCFQTHVRGHGESDGGSGEGGSQTSNNNFRYTCDVCGKKYKYYSCFQEHRDLHAVDDPYDPVVIPVDDVKEDEQMDRLLKVGPNRKRLERFSQKQLDVLFKEVKARHKKLFGTATQAPCVHEVRTAWEEISLAVSAVSPGSKKTSVQCRKRINDLRRRGRQKFIEIWNGIGSTEGSSPAVSFPAPVEASNAKTLKMETMEHLEQTGSDRPETGIYICEFCGKQYKYFNPYQEHVALHTPLSQSSFETQSPRTHHRLKDARKHGNLKSVQIVAESPFSSKMENKSQSSLGDTNSSQNSSGTMCPLVSSSFSPMRTDNENHTPAGTPKPSPAPTAQEQPQKSVPPSQMNSTSNCESANSALPEKEKQQLAERLLRLMCADLASLNVLSGEAFLRLAQALVDMGARHGAFALQDVLGGDTGALALRQLPRMYNQAKVKVTCALGSGSSAGIAITCHAQTAGTRPCYVLTAHQAEGLRLRHYVLAVREQDLRDREGDEQLQHWVQNVLSEFVMPEARAVYVTEPGRLWAGLRAGLGAGPCLQCAGCSLGAVTQVALARRSLLMRGLHEIADLLDLCRHIAAAAGLPWDGANGADDQARSPAPPCWDLTVEALLKVHEHFEQIYQIYGQTKETGPLLQGVNKPLLGKVASLLAPVRQASVELSSDGNATLQLVLPTYMRLEKFFTAKSSEAGAGGKLCHCLLEALKENFKMEPTHQIAMLLDPQLKLRRVPAYQHEDIIARVVKAVAEMGESGDESDGEAGPPLGKRSRMSEGLGPGEGEVRKEVFQYLAEPLFQAVNNLLQYWRTVTERYPRLARLALWLLAVPAVGMRAELADVCQQAVASREQQRVSTDDLNKLIFLKSNTV